MCNDNGSYWVGYLGYPAIAFLMLTRRIKYEERFSEELKNIAWKDINVKFKNDFEKTESFVLDLIVKRGFSAEELISEVERIHSQIKLLNLDLLGKKLSRQKDTNLF